MISAADLIALEAIEQLEASPGFHRIVHSHMPETELVSETTARGRWSLFQYDDRAAGAPATRRHRFAELVVEYEKKDDRWRISSRTVRPLRDDTDDAGPVPAAMDSNLLTGGWLPTEGLNSIDDLVELEAIKQLKARYFRYLDTKDWAAWHRLFTADARFDVPGVTNVDTDTDAFVEAVANNMAATHTVHHGHVPDIVLTGADTASGIWALNDYVEMLAPSPLAGVGNGVRGFGHYEERYRKEGGTWKIANLRLSYLRLDPLVRGPIAQGDLGPKVDDGWLDGAPLPDTNNLADLHAIKQLRARCFRAFDGKAWNAWRGLFTDDALCSPSPGIELKPDRFIVHARERVANAVTIHHGHMPEIRFYGADAARGIWAVFEYAVWPPRGSGYAGYGHYQEEYCRTDDGWRIDSMRVRLLRMDPLPAGRPLEAG